ncbi:MAG: bifunctional oligoribonuclease/PAP phosphatase NrnA [Candidatus Abawacabacteria bacterium]|nr:bifunctional oligoribonuclease/PAP phosphatase NrnA [Candidatus Abawacabacteria bacterium]
MPNLEPVQQIQNLLDQSENILIISHTSIDGDGIGSGLGLQMALTKMGKNVTFYSRHPVPEVFKFLPGINNISTEFSLNQDFIIQIDTSQTKIDNVRTAEDGQNLKIIITPKNGTLNKEDIRLLSGGKKIDLIFTLDTSSLEYTGLMNGPQAELFYETPVVNIDHHITNEHYGKVNFVDVAATSTAELVLTLIETLEQRTPLMDEDMATCLLSGVIVDTGSFQNANTTPKAFAVAARLLTAGARQQEIVRHLFKMHELSTLRLWGKALSRLEHDPELHLAWTSVSQSDFTEVNASESELDGLMDQLITSASDADIVFLMKETADNGVKISLRSLKNIDVTPIVLPFGGGGHQRAAGFKITGQDFKSAQETAIEAVKTFMRQHLAKDTSNEAFHPVQSTIKEAVTPVAVQSEELRAESLDSAPAMMEQSKDTLPEETPSSANSEFSIQHSELPPLPQVNYIPENKPEETMPADISYSQSFDPLPPQGVSKAQEQALQKAYSEPEKPLPGNDFLGYTPPAKSETIMKESQVQTPEEKKAAEVQQMPTPITLKVTKEDQ